MIRAAGRFGNIGLAGCWVIRSGIPTALAVLVQFFRAQRGFSPVISIASDLDSRFKPVAGKTVETAII